jgi:putative tricarboxylic transport membrane protein
MEARSAKDLLSGVALAGFGVYVAIASSQYNYLTDEGPGPGFLPFWLGIAIVSLALCLLVVSQLRAEAPNPVARLQSWSGESRALSAWLALMSAILLSSILGFAVSLMLLAVFIIACLERRSLWSAVVVALGLGIGFHLVFVVLLGVSLPTSPLGF